MLLRFIVIQMPEYGSELVFEGNVILEMNTNTHSFYLE